MYKKKQCTYSSKTAQDDYKRKNGRVCAAPEAFYVSFFSFLFFLHFLTSFMQFCYTNLSTEEATTSYIQDQNLLMSNSLH
jgi:hypothetical protein